MSSLARYTNSFGCKKNPTNISTNTNLNANIDANAKSNVNAFGIAIDNDNVNP